MAVKTWTTPTFLFKLSNTSGNIEQILADAKKVIVTGYGAKQYTRDYEPVIDGSTLTITMTQEDTGNAGAKGEMLIEVTILTASDHVLKSETVINVFEPAVRKKVLEDE